MTDEVFILFTLQSDCRAAAWDGQGLCAQWDGSPGQGSREAGAAWAGREVPAVLPPRRSALGSRSPCWAPAFEEPEKLTFVWWE